MAFDITIPQVAISQICDGLALPKSDRQGNRDHPIIDEPFPLPDPDPIYDNVRDDWATDVYDDEREVPENPIILGTYSRMASPGHIRIFVNRIGSCFRGRHLPSLSSLQQPISCEDVHVLARYAIRFTLEHEFFHFFCDGYRRNSGHGVAFASVVEEPLAQAYAYVLTRNSLAIALSRSRTRFRRAGWFAHPAAVAAVFCDGMYASAPHVYTAMPQCKDRAILIQEIYHYLIGHRGTLTDQEVLMAFSTPRRLNPDMLKITFS